MSVKYYYFDGRGIGEPIRMILAYGGVDFEDIRIPYNKFPPTLPPDIRTKARWGQVPLVEFEGKSLAQSGTIIRYFARKFDLIPKDPYQAALCEEYLDTLRESLNDIYSVFVLEAKEKEEKQNGIIEASKAKFWNVFESIAKANDGKHLLGSSISVADIYLAFCMDHIRNLLGIDLTEGYPNIKNVANTVLNTPKIKAWMENRPKTKY